MNYGIKQSPWFPAFAVSMAIHGVALAFFASAFFASQHSLPAIRLSGSTAVNTLTATLISMPSQHFDNGQNHLSIPNKQVVSTPESKKLTLNKSIKPEQAQKLAKLVKQSFNNKKDKAAQHQATKKLDQLRENKHDVLVRNPSDQRLEMRKKVAVAGQSDFLVAKAANPINERPQATDLAANNKQSSPVAPLAAQNSTSKLPIASASLPPILKSRQPEYPKEARWEERTGKVTVKFKISERGRVIEPSITSGSGHRDLDSAAIQAIQFWRFEPKEGQVDKQWYHYSFRFELN